MTKNYFDQFDTIPLPGNILEGSNIRELRVSAKSYAKGKGIIGARYPNRAIGKTLLIDSNTLTHIFSNEGGIQMHLVPWLPEIIRDAVPLTLNEDHVPRISEIRNIQRFARPIIFRGRRYILILTVKQHLDAKRLHLYDVKAVPIEGVGSIGNVLPPGATQGPRRNGPTTDPTPLDQ